MTVVVGYIPDKFGKAALAEGIEEARRRGTRLLVVNATRGDALIDRRYLGEEGLADLEERLAGLDVDHEVRQAMGADVADEMLRVVAGAGGPGPGDRDAPPHTGGQDDHGERRPAGAARRPLPGARRQPRW